MKKKVGCMKIMEKCSRQNKEEKSTNFTLTKFCRRRTEDILFFLAILTVVSFVFPYFCVWRFHGASSNMEHWMLLIGPRNSVTLLTHLKGIFVTKTLKAQFSGSIIFELHGLNSQNLFLSCVFCNIRSLF